MNNFKKNLKLLNSAVMGAGGIYKMKKISADEFKELVQKYAKRGQLESYIGYESTLDFLKKLTGVNVPLNRELTPFEDGDIFLVIKLKYRVGRPSDKGKFKPKPSDYEFAIIQYFEDYNFEIDFDVLDAEEVEQNA